MDNSFRNSSLSILEFSMKIIQKFLGQPLEVIAAELWIFGIFVLATLVNFKFIFILFLSILTGVAVWILFDKFYLKYPTQKLPTKQKGLDI